MGCFFTCFRFRFQDDDRRRGDGLGSTPGSAGRRRDDLVSKNQLASLFLCEEEDSWCESNSGQDSIEKGLRKEVKLLKACGAISETPVEMRKASKKIDVQDTLEDGSSKILGGTCKKLEWDEENHQTPVFPPTEEMMNDSIDRTNNSACNSRRSASGVLQPERKRNNSLASLLSEHLNTDYATESNLEPSSLNISTQEVERNFPVCIKSPFPTPLTLADDMQTPGTNYPTNMYLALGRKEHVRSQYVYPVATPIKETSQENVASKNDELVKFSKALDQNGERETDHSVCSNIRTSDQVLPDENPRHSSPASHTQVEHFDTHIEGCRKWVAVESATPTESLSQWLKPPVPENGRRKEVFKEMCDTDRDRPIIGSVAAHWNEEELSHISPKWWDGNGIPNSTNKYKEDQKVSWHATPFEERLEKALSEENIYPDRKVNVKPINFNAEDDESDTAAS